MFEKKYYGIWFENKIQWKYMKEKKIEKRLWCRK